MVVEKGGESSREEGWMKEGRVDVLSEEITPPACGRKTTRKSLSSYEGVRAEREMGQAGSGEKQKKAR